MATGKDFQGRCRWLAETAGVAFWFLVVGIGVEIVWQAYGRRLFGAGGGDFRATLHNVGVELVEALPGVFIACALWTVASVFERMGKGVVMAPENARDLSRTGSNVIWAAVAALAITPSLLGWIGEGPGGVRLDFEWASVALLILGVALTLFADVLRDAAAARAELDQIV